MSKEKVCTSVQPEIVATIDANCETRAEWLRAAIAEKLARDGDRKRHLHVEEPIEVELTEFEAMYLSRTLWEYSENAGEQKQQKLRWWSRRLDAMRKTRGDGF